MEPPIAADGIQDTSLTAHASTPRTEAHFQRPPADAVSLVSKSVINQRAFANNCGIPMGAMIDLHSSATLQLPRSSRSPLRCKSCAAFINVYCKTNMSKGLWKCNLCGQVNICKDLASTEPQAFAELNCETVEYALSTASLQQTPRPHVVLLIDATMDASSLKNLRDAILDFVQLLPPHVQLSVISFDNVVSLHNLSGPNQSHALPGTSSIDQALLSHLVHHAGSVVVAEVQACKSALPSVLDSIRPLESQKPLQQRGRCVAAAVEAGLHLLSMTVLEGMKLDARPSQQQQQQQQQQQHGIANHNLLLFVGGPITKGPATVETDSGSEAARSKDVVAAHEYLRSLGEMARSMRAPIDIFWGSNVPINLPLLESLSSTSGGTITAYEGCGPFLTRNIQHALSGRFGADGLLDCYVSHGLHLVQWMGPVETIKAAWRSDAASVVQERQLSGNACSISNMQEGLGVALRLELTQDLEAPAVLLQVILEYVEQSTGQLVQRVVTRRLSVVNTVSEYLRSVDPMMAAILMGKRMALDAKNVDAAHAPKRCEDLRYAVRAQLGLVASRCGKEVQVSRGLLGFGSHKARRWPSELLPVAVALYQLQRGPMLGQAHQHPDRRLLLINTLLTAGCRVSLGMLLPALFALTPSTRGGQVQLAPMPCVSLAAAAADQQRPLLLDCGSELLLLPACSPNGGVQLQAGEHDTASSSAQASSESAATTDQLPSSETLQGVQQLLGGDRIPQPALKVCVQKSAVADFCSRLLPIHCEPVEAQLAQYPGLVQLSEAKLKAISALLHGLERESSLGEWANDVNVQVSMA